MTDKQYTKQILNFEDNQDSPIKNWLVDYVGRKHEPEDNNITVEMIVETMAEEFPEFLLAVAEEKWIRGYQQAMNDISGSEEYTGCGEADIDETVFDDADEDDNDEELNNNNE